MFAGNWNHKDLSINHKVLEINWHFLTSHSTINGLSWVDLPIGPVWILPSMFDHQHWVWVLSQLGKCQLLTAWLHFDHKSSLSRTFSKFADTIKSTSSASSGRFLLKKPSCNIQELALSFGDGGQPWRGWGRWWGEGGSRRERPPGKSTWDQNCKTRRHSFFV